MAFSDMYTQLFAAQKMKPKRHGAFKTFVVEGGGGSLKRSEQGEEGSSLFVRSFCEKNCLNFETPNSSL